MFKRLKAWWQSRNAPKTVTVWGIKTVPWGSSNVPGFPQGGLVALREIPLDSVPSPARNEFMTPRPPRRLKQHGLLNDPASVKKRHREWVISQAPDACLFL